MGWRIACGAILGVTLMRAAMAQVPFAEASVGTSIETWRIPGGESMDMAAARLLFQVADGWRVGPVAYGAVGGQRGGFITLGAEAERAWRLGSTATLDTGFFVGAGGGRGGRELAGGGLMWRAHAGWSMAVSRNDRIGLGVSHVRFPSQGVIRSTQPYFRYERWFESPVRPMGEAGLRVVGGIRRWTTRWAFVYARSSPARGCVAPTQWGLWRHSKPLVCSGGPMTRRAGFRGYWPLMVHWAVRAPDTCKFWLAPVGAGI